MRTDPRACGICFTIISVGRERRAQRQVAHLRAVIGSGPGCFIKVAELARITKAEVRRSDLACAEIRVCVIEIALDADTGIQAARRIHFGKLFHNFLCFIADSGQRPVLAIGTDFAAGHKPAPDVARRRQNARALRGSQSLVDLLPVGQFVVAGPPANITGRAARLGEINEFLHGSGRFSLVHFVQNRSIVHGHTGKAGVRKRGHGINGIGGVFIACVQLVVSLVLVAVDDFVQRGVSVGLSIDDLGDIDNEVLFSPFADLLALAPGGEQVGGAACEQLGLHALVKPICAGIVLQRDVHGFFNRFFNRVVLHAVHVVDAVAELSEADVDRLAAGVGVSVGRLARRGRARPARGGGTA